MKKQCVMIGCLNPPTHKVKGAWGHEWYCDECKAELDKMVEQYG